MNSNISSIVHSIHSIDIEKYNSIESEREKVMQDAEFQKWCSDMRIGSRVEVKDFRATELMQQYTNYPKWVASMY
jgi:hypothetical protein